MGDDRSTISVNVSTKKVETIDKLVDSGKYRNRSHAVDEALTLLIEANGGDGNSNE